MNEWCMPAPAPWASTQPAWAPSGSVSNPETVPLPGMSMVSASVRGSVMDRAFSRGVLEPIGTSQPARHGGEAADDIGGAGGDPHDQAAQLLILERVEAEGERARGVGGVPGDRRQRQQRAECAGMDHGRE